MTQSTKLWTLTIRVTALFNPVVLDFAQCHRQEAVEHLCEKHLQKERRGREEFTSDLVK